MNWMGGIRKRFINKDEVRRRQEKFFAAHAAKARLDAAGVHPINELPSIQGNSSLSTSHVSGHRSCMKPGGKHRKEKEFSYERIRVGKNKVEFHRSEVSTMSPNSDPSAASIARVREFLTARKNDVLKNSTIHGPFSKMLLEMEFDGILNNEKRIKELASQQYSNRPTIVVKKLKTDENMDASSMPQKGSMKGHLSKTMQFDDPLTIERREMEFQKLSQGNQPINFRGLPRVRQILSLSPASHPGIQWAPLDLPTPIPSNFNPVQRGKTSIEDCILNEVGLHKEEVTKGNERILQMDGKITNVAHSYQWRQTQMRKLMGICKSQECQNLSHDYELQSLSSSEINNSAFIRDNHQHMYFDYSSTRDTNVSVSQMRPNFYSNGLHFPNDEFPHESHQNKQPLAKRKLHYVYNQEKMPLSSRNQTLPTESHNLPILDHILTPSSTPQLECEDFRLESIRKLHYLEGRLSFAQDRQDKTRYPSSSGGQNTPNFIGPTPRLSGSHTPSGSMGRASLLASTDPSIESHNTGESSFCSLMPSRLNSEHSLKYVSSQLRTPQLECKDFQLDSLRKLHYLEGGLSFTQDPHQDKTPYLSSTGGQNTPYLMGPTPRWSGSHSPSGSSGRASLLTPNDPSIKNQSIGESSFSSYCGSVYGPCLNYEGEFSRDAKTEDENTSMVEGARVSSYACEGQSNQTLFHRPTLCEIFSGTPTRSNRPNLLNPIHFSERAMNQYF